MEMEGGKMRKGDEYGEMVKVDGWLCRDLG
jgi:hypothetical protein